MCQRRPVDLYLCCPVFSKGDRGLPQCCLPGPYANEHFSCNESSAFSGGGLPLICRFASPHM